MQGVDRLRAVVGDRAGAGATTIAVNLACALAQERCATGLLDLDLASNDAARLCGVREAGASEGDELIPHEVHGFQLFAPGLELQARGLDGLRGELLGRELTELLERCVWNERHIVVVDLPPGGLAEFEELLEASAALEQLGIGTQALPPELAIREAARDGLPFLITTPNCAAAERVRNCARAILRGPSRA